jgi:hypothetical protein
MGGMRELADMVDQLGAAPRMALKAGSIGERSEDLSCKIVI